jgi:hypothetical protein
MLFEERERIDGTYMTVDETTYDFYDRSGLDFAVEVRNRLNRWFNVVPPSEKAELLASFRDNWDSSYFELLLIKVFSNLGYSLDIHPTVSSSRNKPDFLLEKNGFRLICEARNVTDMTDKERSIRTIKKKIIDAIERNMSSEDFFLNIYELRLYRIQAPKLRSLYSKLKAYIDAADRESLIREIEDNGRVSQRDFVFRNEIFSISTNLIPKSIPRGQSSLIGMHSLDTAQFVDTNTSIKSAISKKYKKYGKPGCSFVLALNISSDYGIHFSEIDDLLFGTGVYNMHTRESTRRNNGLFGNKRTPKMTRVSGILFFRSHYSNPQNSVVRYYENPYASFPYDFDGIFPKASSDFEVVSLTEGSFNILDHI